MYGHYFSCSLVHLFKFISGPLEKGSRISNEEYSPGIYSFDKVSVIEFCLEWFSSFPGIIMIIIIIFADLTMNLRCTLRGERKEIVFIIHIHKLGRKWKKDKLKMRLPYNSLNISRYLVTESN